MNKLKKRILSLITALAIAFASVALPNLPGLVVLANAEGVIEGLYNETDDCYEIGTLDELNAFIAYANSVSDSTQCKGMTFKLTADIGSDEAPVGVISPVLKFDGAFDGAGHTITGAVLKTGSIESDYINVGFFCYCNLNSTIQNLTLKNLTIDATDFAAQNNKDPDGVGGICGSGLCSISNCHVTGSIKGKELVGGIIGNVGSAVATISGCSFSGDIASTYSIFGGIAGRSSCPIRNCTVTDTVLSGKKSAGGIAAFMTNSSSSEVSGCTVANVSITTTETDENTKKVTGAIIGQYGWTSVNEANIHDCTYECVNGELRAVGLCKVDGAETTNYDGGSTRRYTVHCGDYVTASNTSGTTYNVGGVICYDSGATFTLSPTAPAGSTFKNYVVKDGMGNDITNTVLDGNTLTMPANTSIVVTAEYDTVAYLDEHGESQTPLAAEEVVATSDSWRGTNETGGWYVLKQDRTITSRIEVTGDVHLILCDSATLTATKGIKVNEGNSLTIYAQSTGESMGALTATGDSVAGIGGYYFKAGGTITINGGRINATGGDGGAGIGGGYQGSGGTVTINGGVVTATGGSENGYGGAGIGGGKKGAGGTVTINGGVVTATGDDGGAGIGGGNGGAGGAITINGGSVTAKGSGSYGGAGIGGGKNGAGDTITINGGVVNATCGGYAACIGGGYYGDGGTIQLLGGQITAHAENSDQTGVGAGDGRSTASITLGWAKADDFIDVSNNAYSEYSYRGSVTVAEGKRFLATKTEYDGFDGGVISAGSVDSSNMRKIRNASLTPIAGYLVNTNGDAVADKEYYSQGDTVTLTPKAGYSFTAVTVTKADGTVEVSVAGGGGSATFTMPGEDVTVTATLEGNSYTVHFNANGGDGTMAPQSFVYGTAQALALCAFTPPTEDKTFDCWATTPSGESGTTYANVQSVSTLTTETEITLYARWKTATEWDALQALLDNAASGATVKLTKDYTAVEGDKDLTVRKNLTLDLNGHVVDGAGQVKSLLGVTDGADLTIIDSDSNAMHDGLSYTDPIDKTTSVPITGGALVRAECGLYIERGTATLKDGSIALSGSYGVRVDKLGNDQGSFVLDGGTVCGNQRGIYCNYGPATIKSGMVCGNSDGGLECSWNLTAKMTGGTISRNYSSGTSAGVHLDGSSQFEMSGGKITGNVAEAGSAGVYIGNAASTFTMTGGEITDNHVNTLDLGTGAGVYANGQFRVSGKVTVSGNTAGENNEPCDVFLSYNPGIQTAPYDHPFLVDGALDPASRIGFAGSYRFGANYDVLPTLATYGLREENRANALDIFFLNDLLNATVSDCRLALYDGELYLTKSAYTITFDPDGGSEVTAQAVPQNELAGGSTIQTYDSAKAVAVKPADPTREGCSFLGWTLNGAAYDFATPVTGDVTLKAKWTVAQPSLTGGTVYAPAGAVLIVASYDTHGKMTSVRSVSAPADGWVGVPIADIASGAGFTLPDTYKLFLVNGETYAPLCEAWDSTKA